MGRGIIMGKPGKIFDLQNSPWGCFGLSAWVFVLGTVAIYFLVASAIPFTEYTCDYRYNLAGMNEPIQAYPEMSIDRVLDYDDWIDSLPYRCDVKGHIVGGKGDIVTLKVNGIRYYEYQGSGGFADTKLITKDFQKVNNEFKIKIPKDRAMPVLTLFHVVIIFAFIVPLMVYLMNKVNDISQNSVRYLAGTDTQYKKEAGGFTKK
jgi:hypothetical protein